MSQLRARWVPAWVVVPFQSASRVLPADERPVVHDGAGVGARLRARQPSQRGRQAQPRVCEHPDKCLLGVGLAEQELVVQRVAATGFRRRARAARGGRRCGRRCNVGRAGRSRRGSRYQPPRHSLKHRCQDLAPAERQECEQRDRDHELSWRSALTPRPVSCAR